MTIKFDRKALDKMVEDALKPPGEAMPGGKALLQKLLGKKGKPELPVRKQNFRDNQPRWKQDFMGNQPQMK